MRMAGLRGTARATRASPSRYASTARGGSAIGASAYFMREDDAPRRGSAYARPDPTGHVIAKQARRAFEASRREDESGGESLRYVRSLGTYRANEAKMAKMLTKADAPREPPLRANVNA